MKILIDIGHPAHVHYFRHMTSILVERGNEVLFTTRDKEITLELLEHFQFRFVNFGKPFKSRVGKAVGLFWFTFRLFRVALKFKPDIFLNATQYSAIVARLLQKPHISLEDTFNMGQVRLYLPFTSVVLTGTYPHPQLGRKEIRYDGYQELAYLHPRYFHPDPAVLEELGVRGGGKYVVLRFISWSASHDFGSDRMSIEQKKKLVDECRGFAKVFISSESPLPDSLCEYKLKISPHRMHDVLAFASLYIGEGATMASECAMLGTPAIYINAQDVHTIREQQDRYGLVFSYRNFAGVIEKSQELLTLPDARSIFTKKRNRMLAETIDLTGFLIWFITQYPESKSTMISTPDFQKRFIISGSGQ